MKKLAVALLGASSVLSFGTQGVDGGPKKLGVICSGYIDGYYQYDLGHPAGGDSLSGRGLDLAHNRPTLAFAELDFVRATRAKSPLGFTLGLYTGKGPDLIHLAEPGGKNRHKLIRQAYITYVTAGKTPVTADFGKFDTWIGYEGVDNRYQDQYSRSFNWTYSETTYETGLRLSVDPSPKLHAAVYAVQGWNEVEDSNSGKSLGVTLAYALTPKTTLTLQDHYGVEGSDRQNDVGSFGGIGFPSPGTAHVHLIDFIAAHQATDATKFAFNVDYGSSKGNTNDGTWNGEVLYVQHKLKPDQVVAFRLDRMEDTDGLRSGAPILFHSLTGTYDYVASKNLTLRFEVRKDFANKPFFNSDNGLKTQRTTLTLAAVARF